MAPTCGLSTSEAGEEKEKKNLSPTFFEEQIGALHDKGPLQQLGIY